MSKIFFQIMGGFTLFVATALLFAGVLLLAGYSPRNYPSGSILLFCARLFILIAVLAFIGVGLLKLRKWAALGFSFLALCAAFGAVWEALHPVGPGFADNGWLGYLFALLLALPSVVTLKHWQTLT